jgi:hypothetical protein
MPAIVQRNAPPSTLTDVIGQVIDAFSEMENATEIFVGARHLAGFGSEAVSAEDSLSPRIIFVPGIAGKWGPGAEMGQAGSISQGCDVYVRAAEDDDDLERMRNADALVALVLSCIRTAATGRLETGKLGHYSEDDLDSFGIDVALSFSYTYDIPHDAERWALAAATADDSAVRPAVPPGEPGTVDSITATVEPVEGLVEEED